MLGFTLGSCCHCLNYLFPLECSSISSICFWVFVSKVSFSLKKNSDSCQK